jgi:hypothetical protein
VSTDQNAVGGLAFFDSTGSQITGGSTSTPPFATYSTGLQQVRAGDNRASLFFYLPQLTGPDTWATNDLVGSASTYPAAGAPAPVGGTALPVNTGSATNLSIDDMVDDVGATSTTAGYQNIYEIRMRTSSAGNGISDTYDYADISVDSAAHTWSVVFTPDAPAGTATTSTLGSSSTSVNQGDTVTLTDTIAPSGATGTVQFKDGASDIGSPVAVTGGVATATAVLSTSGAHAITAVYTAAALSAFTGSTSNTVTINAAHVQTNTSVALALNPTSGPAFSPVAITATVTPAVAGQVKFFDAGQQIGTAAAASGSASITYSGFAQGTHAAVTASFTPTNTTDFTTSTSQSVSFVAGAPTGPAPDPQTITADVAAGSLAITTPYDAGNPLEVGTLALNGAGTQLSGSAQFGDGTTPDGSIKVVDTRAGNANWTASAASGDLTDGPDSINQQNVGLTGLHGIYVAGNALQAGSVTFTDNPAAAPALAPGVIGTAGLGGGPHAFAATTAGGDGTVGIFGTLTINAPTSTQAGHYTGTVTFTVA